MPPASSKVQHLSKVDSPSSAAAERMCPTSRILRDRRVESAAARNLAVTCANRHPPQRRPAAFDTPFAQQCMRLVGQYAALTGLTAAPAHSWNPIRSDRLQSRPASSRDAGVSGVFHRVTGPMHPSLSPRQQAFNRASRCGPPTPVRRSTIPPQTLIPPITV